MSCGYRDKVLRTGTTLAAVVGATLLTLVALVGEGWDAGDLGGGKALLIRVAPSESRAPVEVDGRILRVGDRAVRFPAAVRDVARTDGGVYVVSGRRLWVTDLHGVLRTGVSGMRDLVASPNGRYLGFVDDTTQVPASDGSSAAAVTVYDTTTGERVLHAEAAPDSAALLRLADDGTAYLPDGTILRSR